MKKALAALGAGALMVAGLAAPAAADGNTATYDLIANGGSTATSVDIGDVFVTNNGDGTATVKIDVTGDLDDSYATATKVYGVSIETGCGDLGYPMTKKDNPIPGQYENSWSFPDGIEGVGAFEETVALEECASGEPTVSVHTDVKQNGNYDGYNEIATGEAKFKVVLGSTSYFDTTFTTGPLAGETVEGYCIDVGNTINTNKEYTGTVVSWFDYVDEGNVDKPENFPAVLWLINNYAAGQTVNLTDANGTFSRTLTKGDMQRAIWYLVDDTQSTAGLGSYSDRAAKALRDEALTHLDYSPSSLCGLNVPVVLVIGGQTTIGQTTLALIKVPCETLTATAMAMDTDEVVTEKGNERYGLQFAGDNWFSYVNVPVAAA